MTRILKWTALAALVALMASCCPCRKAQKTTDLPMQGTQWQLVQLDGRTVTAEGETFTVTFGADNRFAGMGACNRLMGAYAVGDNGQLEIGQPASTMMACLKNGEMESAFSQMLAGATHYKVEGDTLLLFTDSELKGVLQAR